MCAEAVNVSDVCCVNQDCPDRGKRGAGNIRFLQWIGRGNDIRFVGCRSCGKRFSERKGTPLFRAQLPLDEIESITKHLREGDGQRKTARLTGHKRSTVAAWTRKLGGHARAIHEEKVQHLDIPEAQVDEKWSFVGEKRRPPDRRGAGARPAGR